MLRHHDYLPFGEEYHAAGWVPENPPAERKLFTGQERDVELGLDYFGARYDRADIGRFSTVDPDLNVNAALLDPQRWNRYAYARNNPVRYVDPDGRDIFDFVSGVFNAIGANIALGAGRGSGNQDFVLGQRVGDVLSLAGSAIETTAGSGMALSGVAACGTGVGCLAGAPAVAGGATLAGHGVGMGAAASISLMKGVGSNSEGMLGSGGTQTTSKTLYNREGVRLDVENPNPGSRPRQIHVQIGKQKYLYDPATGQFQNAPSSIQKLLENERFKKAIETGMRYLGAQ